MITIFNPLLERASDAIVRVRGSRNFYHIALGVRSDGVKVWSTNGTSPAQRMWQGHAEARLCKKLTPYSIVYVIRLISDRALALSRPCDSCIRLMRRKGVEKCVYSIDNNEYGVIHL